MEGIKESGKMHLEKMMNKKVEYLNELLQIVNIFKEQMIKYFIIFNVFKYKMNLNWG